uniref:Cytochrome b n=1 Tax=Hyalomma asiaticum TaxID=266040 RepID=A0A7T8V8L9_HYAAI|nr:cytochrome b [Hyalomma asiaticum]QQQ89479.1 cytochrome b [Hyalomma asiaticum]UNO54338.1 cytochrome b [Hyalomma asiaticum]UNO54351.1 cytochrome b [Hyalomma asiaticum]WKW91685.1 cytochrome b [Hyalomma asiaticum]
MLLKLLSPMKNLPTPSNISYMWNFGSLLGMCLMIQIFTGLFLAMNFSSDITTAFKMISHIQRDVNNGWLIRSIHANGASMFFIFLYIHIARGIYYSSFFFLKVWISGILMIFILMGTAFLGYILPWGQMSFWGATVITNLISAIPYIGSTMTFWIWGGFSVDNNTLMRFFTLHFLFPFILTLMAIIHIMLIHEKGSSNPFGLSLNIDKISFHPYFMIKDLLGIFMIMLPFMYISIIYPYSLMDAENFNMANPMITPPHIQPEWYFLFAYAILRSIPNKLGGVIALLMSIVIIISFSFTMKNKLSSFYFNNFKKILFWTLINCFLMLTYLGAMPIEYPFDLMSKISTIFYFFMFILIPLF